MPLHTSTSFLLIQQHQTLPKQTVSQRTDEASDMVTKEMNDEPVPLRELLVYPIVLSVSNYVVLAFLNIAVCALLPLFLAMPLAIGGLGFDPPVIGYLIGSYGLFSGVFQAIFFAKIVRHFGERRVFVASMAGFIPVFLLFPIINIMAQRFGPHSFVVWSLIILVLWIMAILDMAYGMFY